MSVGGTPLIEIVKSIIKIVLKSTTRIKPIILFESFNGAQYSDNPRAISEMMHSMYPEYQIAWYLNSGANKELVPDYVKCISNRIEFYKYLFSSFCYVNNCQFQGLKRYKKKGQLYIQTWHGDRGFKKILYEADPDWCRANNMCDNDVVDIALAGSDFGRELYRSAFRYKGQVDALGCPRNERMLQMSLDEKRRIKKELNIDDDIKVLLYAPTFRDNIIDHQQGYIDIETTRRQISKKYGGKWIAMVRGHVGKKWMGLNNLNPVVDVTDYPDMADILAITDFLITDYSSTAFDFYLTDKPMILAIFDLADYEANCRELKFDPVDAGFICAVNQKELEKMIENLDNKLLQETYERIDRVFGTKETGSATKNICSKINAYYINTYIQS